MAAALDLSAPQEVINNMVAVIDKLCRKWIKQKKKNITYLAWTKEVGILQECKRHVHQRGAYPTNAMLGLLDYVPHEPRSATENNGITHILHD